MRITFGPKKRRATLDERGLDFTDADLVFGGETLDAIDDRHNDGETRLVTVGHLRGRMVVLVWTDRDGARHVFSMSKADDREQKLYRERLGQDRRP